MTKLSSLNTILWLGSAILNASLLDTARSTADCSWRAAGDAGTCLRGESNLTSEPLADRNSGAATTDTHNMIVRGSIGSVNWLQHWLFLTLGLVSTFSFFVSVVPKTVVVTKAQQKRVCSSTTVDCLLRLHLSPAACVTSPAISCRDAISWAANAKPFNVFHFTVRVGKDTW
eukprot:m.408880 g.408880  ORF g.408880 m.408880 type:complete len:172 (-) comp20150_c5_seq3:1876-2391(-)